MSLMTSHFWTVPLIFAGGRVTKHLGRDTLFVLLFSWVHRFNWFPGVIRKALKVKA